MKSDPAAGQVEFARHLDGLRAAALRLAGSSHEADDLVQDCLAAAVQDASRLPLGTPLGAWLHQVLRRRWYDLIRRRVVERRHRAQSGRAAPSSPDAEGSELVRRALGALEPEARRLLELRFFQARRSVDIARELGRPVGTVRSQLFYALRKFESEFQRLKPREDA
jgi:RNA polymerase sigma-70 factor (ECF subfamily)